MNIKKTKKNEVLAMLLAVMVAIPLASCTSDFMDEEQYGCSLSKKERIEELAKDYGLSIKICGDVSSIDLYTIEEDFRGMNSLLGDYAIYPSFEDKKHDLNILKNESLKCFSVPPTTTESCSWSDSKSVLKYKVSVSLTWELDSMRNLKSHVFSPSVIDTDNEASGTYSLVNKNSHGMGRAIVFSTEIKYYLNDNPIQVLFSLSGSCNYDTGLGYFNLYSPNDYF